MTVKRMRASPSYRCSPNVQTKRTRRWSEWSPRTRAARVMTSPRARSPSSAIRDGRGHGGNERQGFKLECGGHAAALFCSNEERSHGDRTPDCGWYVSRFLPSTWLTAKTTTTWTTPPKGELHRTRKMTRPTRGTTRLRAADLVSTASPKV